MPKKKKGHKRPVIKEARQLPIADLGQTYGVVINSLGDRRMIVKCQDGKNRIGRIRGSIRKRKSSWISVNSNIIVAFREFQDDKCDIIEILNDDEVRRLKKMDEIVDESIEEKTTDLMEFEFETEDLQVSINGEINIDDI